MFQEKYILIAAWIIAILALVKYVPRNKIREAQVIFLFKQSLTWILGLIVVEKGLIEYPIREFQYATSASFTFEFFVYPAICVMFNLYYPENKGRLRQYLHYIVYTSLMTAFEDMIERYTDLIAYLHWDWYWTWLSVFLTFYLSRVYFLWFFKKRRGSMAE